MSTPKIVDEDAPQTRLAGVQVVVGQYGSVVVEHELSPERVPVDEERSGSHRQSCRWKRARYHFCNLLDVVLLILERICAVEELRMGKGGRGLCMLRMRIKPWVDYFIPRRILFGRIKIRGIKYHDTG